MTAALNKILWTAKSAIAATNGRCDRDFAATGVSIDTRTINPGDLFIALEGLNFDGHDFVIDALDKGASAALVHRTPIGATCGAPIIIAGNTMKALYDLAAAARARAKACIVAVTGSVGKTGVKEALKFLLGAQAGVCATSGNLNNHWGLPLSLARLPADCVFGIFEMGMNHPGEIEPLSKLARPHVALITSVELAHSAFFANVEAIADAKAEIFCGMTAGGIALLNRDNKQFQRLAAAAAARGVTDIRGFGASQQATARLVKASLEADGSRLAAVVDGQDIECRVGVPGSHWIMNSLALLAAVSAAGGDVRRAADDLKDFRAMQGRGRINVINIPGGVITIIDESYNANPASMGAALEVLGLTHPKPGARRIAVLGDMLELGPQSSQLHAALAGPLQANQIDLAFTAGPEMACLASALPSRLRGGQAACASALAPMVTAAVRPGDVVMIKGSAGSKVGIVLEALLGLQSMGAGPGFNRAVNGE